jgi:hypothetical protein
MQWDHWVPDIYSVEIFIIVILMFPVLNLTHMLDILDKFSMGVTVSNQCKHIVVSFEFFLTKCRSIMFGIFYLLGGSNTTDVLTPF